MTKSNYECREYHTQTLTNNSQVGAANNIKLKRVALKVWWVAVLLGALALLALPLFGQDTPPPNVIGDTVTVFAPPNISPNPIQSFLDGLMGKYGWLTTVFLVMASARTLFKPVMTLIENNVANDPAKAKKLEEFEHGPIFKAISYVLDFGASIKLPAAKAALSKPTQ